MRTLIAFLVVGTVTATLAVSLTLLARASQRRPVRP